MTTTTPPGVPKPAGMGVIYGALGAVLLLIGAVVVLVESAAPGVEGRPSPAVANRQVIEADGEHTDPAPAPEATPRAEAEAELAQAGASETVSVGEVIAPPVVDQTEIEPDDRAAAPQTAFVPRSAVPRPEFILPSQSGMLVAIGAWNLLLIGTEAETLSAITLPDGTGLVECSNGTHPGMLLLTDPSARLHQAGLCSRLAALTRPEEMRARFSAMRDRAIAQHLIEAMRPDAADGLIGLLGSDRDVNEVVAILDERVEAGQMQLNHAQGYIRLFAASVGVGGDAMANRIEGGGALPLGLRQALRDPVGY
ncbi:hypothetical protein [Roseobacter sp. HKCCA0434]|uniref:hypothetical protein n=1 Tax=Roseobacter sp. HKCCA0434 TaxID=3079297 RepID=UPI002905C41B|nr:hypothetical protein [Roseobacter sp. HKCCA0434]